MNTQSSEDVWFGAGDVFREYTVKHFGVPDGREQIPAHSSELDPGATHAIATGLRQSREPGTPLYVYIDDLHCASRAALVIEYWGGHIGTQLEGFCVNNTSWYAMPGPRGTKEPVQHYHRTFLGNPAVEIPLESLREGVNTVQFAAGAQTIHDFGCGFFWIYSVSIRVYYDGAKPHPRIEIDAPSKGNELTENPELSARVWASNHPVVQVDFFGNYLDFDWEGNGLFQQWHYQSQWGTWRRFAARAVNEPYRARWLTEWLPDQVEPVSLAARVCDASGICTISPIVTDLSLARSDRHVYMYPTTVLPVACASRTGRRAECTITITDSLERAQTARLVVPTWSGAHGGELGLNGHILIDRVGLVHDYHFGVIEVPLNLLHRGDNIFHVLSHTEHHAVEINFPGPALVVAYENQGEQ